MAADGAVAAGGGVLLARDLGAGRRRGTWVLADVYIYPNDLETSAWASVAIGYGGMLVLAARQLCCGSSAARTAVTPAADADLASAIGSTPAAGSAPLRMLHGYLVAFLVVNCWRGVWFLLDLHVLVDDQGGLGLADPRHRRTLVPGKCQRGPLRN